jgi:hypothetical protein
VASFTVTSFYSLATVPGTHWILTRCHKYECARFEILTMVLLNSGLR